MMRSTWIVATLLAGVPPALSAQSGQAFSRGSSFTGTAVHYGKWLTAGAAGAFIGFASREHQKSRREWNALLDICRSADDACAIGADGRYLRSDAEVLYQRSRVFDRRANHRLLGAQVSLLATAALFLLDLHPGKTGPDNIPFSPLRVTAEPTSDGARLGLELRF
jgi:hypothetical protein